MPKSMRRVSPMSRPKRDTGGAPKGNQNAVKPGAKDSSLALRCRRTDKAAWVHAANKADRAGELECDQSVLAAWVIRTLNRAADKENTPAQAAFRQKAELTAVTAGK